MAVRYGRKVLPIKDLLVFRGLDSRLKGWIQLLQLYKLWIKSSAQDYQMTCVQWDFPNANNSIPNT